MDPNMSRRSRYMDALAFYPSVSLDLQHEDEKIVLLIREHPIVLIPWILNSIGLAILLILLNILLPGLFDPVRILFINIFASVLIFAYAWLNFLRWYYQVGIVTNERIVDIDFKSVLYKEVNIARLANVEEITSKSAGFVGTLFNFGNIFVETAGADINIEFPNAPDPSYIVKLINQLSSKTNG